MLVKRHPGIVAIAADAERAMASRQKCRLITQKGTGTPEPTRHRGIEKD
jgi:hypothetical protein